MSVTLYPAGHTILQVKQFTTATSWSTTGGYADTPLTTTFTPVSASSTILIQCSFNMYNQSSNSNRGGVRLNRSGTTIYQNDWAMQININYIQAWYNNINMTYLDSPASTSTLTYTVQMANITAIGSYSGVGFNYGTGNGVATMTIIELSGV